MEHNQLEQLKHDPVSFVQVIGNVKLSPHQEDQYRRIMQLVVNSRPILAMGEQLSG